MPTIPSFPSRESITPGSSRRRRQKTARRINEDDHELKVRIAPRLATAPELRTQPRATVYSAIDNDDDKFRKPKQKTIQRLYSRTLQQRGVKVVVVFNFLVLCYTSSIAWTRMNIQRLFDQPPPPLPNNAFSTSWNDLLKDDNFTEWYPLGSVEFPYTPMAPELDVVWARGWYNAIPPQPSVSIDYYNSHGQGGKKTILKDLEKYFPEDSCGGGTVWVRVADMKWWAKNRLPLIRCDFTLITGDGINDVPKGIIKSKEILDHPNLVTWYAQNVVDNSHPKLQPIPLGLPIHYGFPSSPDSAYTVQKMLEIRKQMPSFRSRNRRILFDRGTTIGGGARVTARKQAQSELSLCNDSRVEFMPKLPTLDTWKTHYSTHQFAIVVRGTGWDTYRTWEYLFYGTVPILLKGTPMDHLHLPAHTPVVFVERWKDICAWDDDFYAQLEDRYEHWIANAHKWLRPSLWVPRNQTEMDRLCDISPGCREEPIYMRMIDDAMDSVTYERKVEVEAMKEAKAKKVEQAQRQPLQDNFGQYIMDIPKFDEEHEDALTELLQSAKPGEIRGILRKHPDIVEKLKDDLKQGT